IRDFHVTGVQTCALPIFCRSRLSLDGGHLLLPGGGIRHFVLLPDATVANGNLRDTADGAHSASVLRRTDFRGADVYVCAFRSSRSEERRVGKEWRYWWWL